MRLVIVILSWLVTAPLYALPATGEFAATRSCELFQSKRKQTNPGGLLSEVGERYRIIEAVLSRQQLSWVRVVTQAEVSPERWVAANCGDALNLVTKDQPVVQNHSCSVPDQYDSQVLALSWQSAFCQLRGSNKAECQTQHAARFDANHFSLHGLWPNKQACGRKYGYCGVVKDKPARFCDYPAVTLSDSLQEQLALVMPSAAAGTCLERHEWWKHGVCSSDTPEQYYEVALALTDQINSGQWLSQFIQPNIGKRVSQKAFRAAFEQSFGTGAARRLGMTCSDGLLSEILIYLPAQLDAQSQLHSILPLPLEQGSGKGNCPAEFTLDAAGF